MKGLHEAAIKTGILVPGGSSLNTARCAQAILPPRQVVFFGSIGGDQFGEILQTKCNEIGLGTVFQIRDGEKTGTCIAVLNGEHKTRILFGNYDEFSHLFRKIIDKKAELNILEEEHNFPTVEGCTDELMPSLFRFSKRYPIMNIIITNGTYPTIHAINGNILSQNVQLVSPEEIADSVGAGDAFTAGFLVRYLTDQDIFSCIKLGHILAAEILKLSGVPFNLPFHNPDMGPINAK
ncbi:adenosine kinase [Mitosporidium daphniae]|uniref:Adenosine kinase n=1 Tax=Mitosporidium daphniae TaxID=1485682 RepID=A0A098VT35_9MICR|nr:adenosine kinase [Mitosporidium daphniae]KGG52145.1 adenosine kinase [Mitosporidium daphniae]|eukprot:XP_013238581.1 adenosine kinase [Mitosporidium daphniae]